MSERYEWRPEWSSGHPVIDHQHRELLRLVNLLVDAGERKGGAAVRREAFQALFRYMDRHFPVEEEHLAALGSPLLDAHRGYHAMLREELEFLWDEERKAKDQETAGRLKSWVIERLLLHMVQDDLEAFRSVQDPR